MNRKRSYGVISDLDEDSINELNIEKIDKERPVSSESDEDLPEVLNTSTIIESPDPKIGDLLLVKYWDAPFWPAVVKSVYKKKKKITVRFVGRYRYKGWQKLTLKFSPKNIKLYDKREVASQEEYGPDANMILRRSDAYFWLRLRDGDKLDPDKFFSDLLDGSEQTLDPDECPNQSESISRSVQSSLDPDECSNQSESISTSSESLSEEIHRNPNQEKEEDNNQESPDPPDRAFVRRSKKNAKLIEFMKTEELKLTIMSILDGKKASQFYDNYKSCTKPKRKKDLVEQPFGPIDDEEQMDNIFNILTNQHGLAKYDKYSHDTDLLRAVIIPEAVIYSMVNVLGVKYRKAVSMFNMGCPRSRREYQNTPIFHRKKKKPRRS